MGTDTHVCCALVHRYRTLITGLIVLLAIMFPASVWKVVSFLVVTPDMKRRVQVPYSFAIYYSDCPYIVFEYFV